MNKAVIIGAGWLGLAVAKHLRQHGWQVATTTRDSKKLNSDITTQFSLESGQLSHSIELDNAFWFYCIPAGRTALAQQSYFRYLDAALMLSAKLNCRGFLMASSTAIYPNESEQFDENSQYQLVTERQQRMARAETTVLNQGGKVLRFAGLFGPNRHPGRFLAGKELTSCGDDTVNMVHQADCVQAIHCLFDNWLRCDAIYNCVAPEHPSKSAFYAAAADKLSLPKPVFNGKAAIKKVVSGAKLTQLPFTYQHGELLCEI